MRSKLYVNQVENVILGSDPPNISTSQMEGMIVPIISLIEQQRINNLLNEQIEIQLKYVQQLQKNIRLKTALMQDLLTGKKRVTALLKKAEEACV